MRSRFLAVGLALAALLAFAPAPARALTLSLDGDLVGNCSTASATAGAATLANKCGKITSESITTAAGATYTLTLTNTNVAATDICFANVAYGTSTTGTPAVTRTTAGAGSLIVILQNIHASAAFNGTVVIGYFCMKP